MCRIQQTSCETSKFYRVDTIPWVVNKTFVTVVTVDPSVPNKRRSASCPPRVASRSCEEAVAGAIEPVAGRARHGDASELAQPREGGPLDGSFEKPRIWQLLRDHLHAVGPEDGRQQGVRVRSLPGRGNGGRIQQEG